MQALLGIFSVDPLLYQRYLYFYIYYVLYLQIEKKLQPIEERAMEKMVYIHGGALSSLIRTNIWPKKMELENIVLNVLGGLSAVIGHEIRNKCLIYFSCCC